MSRDDVLRTIHEFDKIPLDDLKGWQDKSTYKYAVVHDGRRYPPKHILSKTTNVPTSNFNGGEQTNRVFRELGFQVEELNRSDFGKPFDGIFADEDEANWAFDVMRETLERLGAVDPDDERHCFSIPGHHNECYLRLIFARWLVLDIVGSNSGLAAIQLTLLDDEVESFNLEYARKEPHPFRHKEGERACRTYNFPIAQARPLEGDLREVYERSMRYLVERFSEHRRTSFRRHHIPELHAAAIDQEARERILREGIDLRKTNRSGVWWVNQGETFARTRELGQIAAPTESRDGRQPQHWSNLSLMQESDTVIHYRTGHIVARSSVVTEATEAASQAVAEGIAQGREYETTWFVVDVDLDALETPIVLEEIPEPWRKEEASEGPFDRLGNVRQGYAFPISDSLVTKLARRFPELFGRRIFKIAPGESASEWSEHLEEGISAIGWDWTGDLNDYTDEDELREAIETHNEWHAGPATQLARSLIDFRDLQPGDLVVANRGKSEILAVGAVQEPGYQWRPERASFRHIVPVDWDTSAAKSIPRQGAWLRTIVELEPQEYRDVVFADEPEGEPDAGTGEEYARPTLEAIRQKVLGAGLRIPDRTLRRYHLSLETRKFVILAGISGTGKTWLAQAYAKAMGAHQRTVAVAPNWTTNEDLLGYFNPFSGTYQDTEFTRFLRQAAAEYRRHRENPRPYHLILDEMNLARVEYYFAKFLSAMETRQREGVATIELSSEDEAELTPNLYFIGTVNIDETTHGFADKVYDRGQLIELYAPRDHIANHLSDQPYRETLLRIWDIVETSAPFAYRVIDEIGAYVDAASNHNISWQDALDEQVVQKVLPKVKGAEPSVGESLELLARVASEEGLSLTERKIEAMLTKFRQHGITSYF